MTSKTHCTPFAGTVDVESQQDDGIVTSTVVDGEEPVFAGHYPGFPIFPGVCLIECVHQSVLAAGWRKTQDLELDAVESSRFLSPVFPEDRITTYVRIAVADGAWRCSAVLSTDRGKAAEIRLRYRMRSAT